MSADSNRRYHYAAALIIGTSIVGISGIVLGTVAAAPASAPQPTPAGPSTVATIIDSSHKLFQIAAIVLGGIWAYYKFFRGRTFRPRLEPTLEASVVRVGTALHLKAKAQVKNVGLSKVVLDKEVSGLRIFTVNGGSERTTEICPVEWQRRRTLDVFKDHAWIESGETIEDNWLLSLPASQDPSAFRLELKLAGPKTDWYANAIIEAPPQPAAGIFSGLLEHLLPSPQHSTKGGNDESSG
jgi:hypothetical protein